MKKQLAEDMVAFMAPIRAKAADLQANKELLAKIITNGAEKARYSANETLKQVRKAVGVNYI